MRPLVRVFPSFYRLRHKISAANLEKDRAVVAAALDRIEQKRQGRAYLVGDTFTIADLTAAALMGPVLQPPEIQYPLQVELPQYLQDYRATLLQHPAAKWAAGIYRLHRGHSMEVPDGRWHKLMKCPKCGYERRPSDDAPEWQCPSCKVAYAKVKLPTTAPAVAPVQQAPIDPPDSSAPPDEEIGPSVEEWEQEERNLLAAQGQKILIYSIILNLVLRSAEQSGAFPELAITLLFFCTAAYSLLGIVRISSGLDRHRTRRSWRWFCRSFR